MNYIIKRLSGSHNAKFMSTDFCEKHGCMPSMSDYVMIYVGQIYNVYGDETLNHIYRKLNVDHPADYHLPSLSVSDVIGLEVGEKKFEWWYVDDIGFTKIWEED